MVAYASDRTIVSPWLARQNVPDLRPKTARMRGLSTPGVSPLHSCTRCTVGCWTRSQLLTIHFAVATLPGTTPFINARLYHGRSVGRSQAMAAIGGPKRPPVRGAFLLMPARFRPHQRAPTYSPNTKVFLSAHKYANALCQAVNAKLLAAPYLERF